MSQGACHLLSIIHHLDGSILSVTAHLVQRACFADALSIKLRSDAEP